MNPQLLLRSGRSSVGFLFKPNTRLTCHPTSLFLQLPPSYHAFHASPKPRIVDTLLTSTNDILNGIHTVTGLPWAFTLPVSALIIRLALTLPLTIYNRSAIQQQLDLQPLLRAWTHQIRKDNMKKMGHLGPALVQRNVAKEFRIKRREIFRRWNCGYWKNFIPVLQLPVWLLMVETVRAMCGTHKGLLGLFFSNSGSNAIPASVGASSELAAGAQPDIAVKHVLASVPLDAGGPADAQGLLENHIVGENGVSQTAVLFEPSLAYEGALWFPDLTAADPLLILPFMLSATMFLNIYATGKRGSPIGEMTPFRRRLARALGLVALAAGPLTLQMPSAILLYWVSSGLLGYGQGVLLDRFMPLRFPPKSCRPIARSVEEFGYPKK